jgi:Protein of unknown function (DUF3616)
LKRRKVKPIYFAERPHDGSEPHNASDIVAIADSRFLFCDNNISDAIYELRLTPEGQAAGPIVRRPIEGISTANVDDLEGMALVEDRGRRFIFAIPSLTLKRKKKHQKEKKAERGEEAPARNGLLRITIGRGAELRADLIPGFRAWLIDNAPELGKAPRYLPDDGGLNVEGLGWSPAERALLIGVRTPVIDGRPLVLRVRVKEVAGPWTLNNLEMLPAVFLGIEKARGEQGIRGIDHDPLGGALLVVVGNSTSSSKAPFNLYRWDGNVKGAVGRFHDVRFHKKMRVEGVARGTIDGRKALVFVDDAGGYQVLWEDDQRLRL